jgi:hypothetical protein
MMAATRRRQPASRWGDRSSGGQEVAMGFLEAYGAFDAEQAITDVSDDATIRVDGSER